MANVAGYLRLVRLPNVFTALADVLAGWAISHIHDAPPLQGYLPVAGASAALYLSGMAFNDIADRDEDAETRPQRPIPSGQVSLRGALICAAVLMAIGLGLAAWCGIGSLRRAGPLAVAILFYNFRSKKHVITGPLMLGFCRFANVQLGMSGHPDFDAYAQNFHVWEWPWAPALAGGLYAAGVTAFSAQEETGKRARAIVLGWLFCGAAMLFAGTGRGREAWLALFPLALVLSFMTHRLRRLGTPEAAKGLVRAGVMGICVMYAGLILGFA